MDEDNDVAMRFFCSPSEYDEYAKIANEEYLDLQEMIKSDNRGKYNVDAMVKTLTKFKTDQVACLIGYGLTDYDKKILSGVIERHIAGVLSRG